MNTGQVMALAKIGPIFPLRQDSKLPAIKAWQKKATRDSATISKWASQHPAANWALATGHEYGSGFLCVVDLDCKSGKDGFASLESLQAEYGALPDCPKVRTAGGGEHWFFLSRAPIANSAGKIGAGIDTRGAGGYVVAAGSSIGGKRYEPANDCDSIPMLPEAWEKLLSGPSERPKPNSDVGTAAPSATKRATAYLASLAMVHEGGRNLKCFQAAAVCKDYGLPEQECIALMTAEFRCRPPLPSDELIRTVQSAYNRAGLGSESPENDFERVPNAATSKPNVSVAPVSAAALVSMRFEPMKFTIDNLLPEGVFLLAASPKVGKSWLALQICIGVASGGDVLGEHATAGRALYLALEDGQRRLQSRLQTLGADKLPPKTLDRLECVTEWPRIGEGGAEALDAWLVDHPDTRLVAIDVLERVRPHRDPKAPPYAEDYRALSALKKIAEARRVTILIVHHTRKAKSEDAIELVSGTQGLTGAADGVLVLRRPRGQAEGVLSVMARDLQRDGDFAVSFDGGAWSMVGPAAEVARSHLQNEILDVLQSSDAPMTAAEIARAVGRAKSTAWQSLRTMTRAGTVWLEDGKYRAAVALDSKPSGQDATTKEDIFA